MFDDVIRARFASAASPLAKACVAQRVTPLTITWAGFVIAIGASVTIAFGHSLLGLFLWLISRIADGLDGVVARQGQTASFRPGSTASRRPSTLSTWIRSNRAST